MAKDARDGRNIGPGVEQVARGRAAKVVPIEVRNASLAAPLRENLVKRRRGERRFVEHRTAFAYRTEKPSFRAISCTARRKPIAESAGRVAAHEQRALFVPFADDADFKTIFDATLEQVTPEGLLILRDTAGNERKFGFKEVGMLG